VARINVRAISAGKHFSRAVTNRCVWNGECILEYSGFVFGCVELGTGMSVVNPCCFFDSSSLAANASASACGCFESEIEFEAGSSLLVREFPAVGSLISVEYNRRRSERALDLALIMSVTTRVEIQSACCHSTMSTDQQQNIESAPLLSVILQPGSSLHPTFLLILDVVLGSLALLLLALLYLTGGNLHFVGLLGVELSLWATLKW
jgi:ER protein Pkr1